MMLILLHGGRTRKRNWKLVTLKRFSIFEKNKKIETLFYYIAAYSPFLPILLFFLFYRTSKKQNSLWAIVGFAILTVLTFFLEPYIPKKSMPLKIFFGATTFYEYSFFTYFIWNNINSKKFKRVISIATAFFFLFLLLYYANTKLKRVDSFPIGVESILILIFCFYFFYEEVNNPDVLFIYNDYKFWITTGIMIYISGSFFIYIFANQIPIEKRYS